MDYLTQLIRNTKLSLFFVVLLDNAILIGVWWLGSYVLHLQPLVLIGILAVLVVLQAVIISVAIGGLLVQPLRAIWQTILHLAPHQESVLPPKPESIHFGRELVATLSSQIYQLATVAEHSSQTVSKPSETLHANFI